MTIAPLDKLQQKYNAVERVHGDAPGPAARPTADVAVPESCENNAGKPAERCASAAGTKPDTCEYRTGAAGWRGCASICLLKHYLAENPDLGACVGLCPDGRLAMRFRPGIGKDEGDRLHAAVVAVELLEEARDDILRMVGDGSMSMRRFRDVATYAVAGIGANRED